MSFASLWADLVAAYGPRRIELVGLAVAQVLGFWLPAAIYLGFDWLAPAFSARHKIQPAPRQPTRADLRDCARVVLRNNVLTLALAVALALAAAAGDTTPSPSQHAFGVRVTPLLPSAGEVVRDLVLSCVLREILFYYAHRLLHRPRWYRAIHKTHHRFTAPVALAAQYAHPVEHLVANALPVGGPPLLLRAHVLTYWLFVVLMLLETGTVHSGYDFFGGAARRHDAHHEKFTVHYGVFGWLDWLHGTDEHATKQPKATTEKEE
ncbi:Fatty acid hydroxylase [Niveomyces insectorum RCEF 264]|uniref:Fatty acid hydroxylase n=1 Tax=Niveomyces insectorum RCEF 264 TaxID=1081102 RepID=A0A167Y3Y3_9HYPO|nr:Fatty acid hydroxylase [Niveomyces insectorum RCEF 264]